MLTDLVLCICDNADAHYGVNETASPKRRTTPPSIAQTEDLSVVQDGLPTAVTCTSRISSLPAELEHFKPGTNLELNNTIVKVKFQLSLSSLVAVSYILHVIENHCTLLD